MRSVKEFFRKGKRSKLTIVSALFIVYSVAAAGIFSYFHGSDKITNRLAAVNGSVVVSEPSWNSTGQYMASASEPGMLIPKDPSALNNGGAELYIRLKMTVWFDSYSGFLTGSDSDDGEVGIPSNEKRYKGIIGAVRLGDTGFIPNSSEDLSDWYCNNGNYVFAEYGQSLDGEKLELYFYYTAGDVNSSNVPVMRSVKPGESTSELFTAIDVPVYKKDYLGIFDQNYNIDIQAEAVPVENYDAPPTIDQVSSGFEAG